MTDQIDELSNNTLQSVAKKRAEQSKEAGGVGINNPTRAKAMSLLRKSDDAKYRHTEHPDKVTPKTPPPAPTEADKAAHAKANKAKVDSQNNRGYGEGRYMGDSVEQTEVVDQLDEHAVGSMVQVRLGGKWHQAQVTAGPHKESGHIEAKFKVGTKTIKTRFNPETEVKPVAEEVESLDELSMDTVKSYKAKVATNPAPSKTTPNLLHKAIRRFAGKERAEDRIHSDEMKKMRERLGLKNEEVLDEGKFLETHKGEDAHGEPKPNPKHPAYATHKKAYDAKVAERKATTFGLKHKEAKAKTPVENPVKMHHIDSAISNSFPDVEPYEHLKRQFPHLHKEDHPTHGTKLTYWADKAVAAHDKKHKTLSSYADAAYKDMHDDKMMGEDAAQKNMSNAMDNIDPGKRDAARKQYTAAREKGLTHASSLSLMHQRFGKTNEETLDELNNLKIGAYGSDPGAIAGVLTDLTLGAEKLGKKAYHGAKNLIQKYKERKAAEAEKARPTTRVTDRLAKFAKEPTANEEVKTEKPGHKVGDTVWATSPTNKALTMTGKVTKIGQTLTTVQHKDGSEAHYPHKLVNNDYDVLHPTPKKWQREHLEQTGELLSLAEVKYMIENANGGVGAIAQHAGVDGAGPQGTGKVKKMMGNKTDAAAIAKIIVNGAKSKEERN